jgi:hypothetical protein
MEEQRGAEAVKKFTEAQELRQIGRELEKKGHPGTFEYMQADRTEKEAEQLLKPAGEIVRGSGEAIDLGSPEHDWNLVETLKHPNSVSLGASGERMRLLADEDVDLLMPGLDAAESIRAANSLEKMLAHQMAVAHYAAIRLMARAAKDQLPPIEAARLGNTAARFMEVYQGAFLTLMKVRTGGKQTVVVQHQQVNVSDGGQAVIAGNIKAGGRRGRANRK